MSDPAKIQCPHCGGEKRCTSCTGTGVVERMGVRMTCAVCNGGGQCLPCGGSGEIENGGDPPISAA